MPGRVDPEIASGQRVCQLHGLLEREAHSFPGNRVHRPRCIADESDAPTYHLFEPAGKRNRALYRRRPEQPLAGAPLNVRDTLLTPHQSAIGGSGGDQNHADFPRADRSDGKTGIRYPRWTSCDTVRPRRHPIVATETEAALVTV